MSKTINTAATTAFLLTFGLPAIVSEMEARGLKPVSDPETGAALLAMGCKSLDDVAVTVVNLTNGSITAEELHEGFVKCFPEHKIGDRHAPHYLSLARTGNHNSKFETRVEVPKASRKAKGAAAKGLDLSGVADDRLTIMLTATEGTPMHSAVAREIEKRSKALAEAQATPDEVPAPTVVVEESKKDRDARIKAERLAARAARDAAAQEAAQG